MKVVVFSTEAYDREFLTVANADAGHDLTFYEPRLTAHTCTLAAGFPAICAFVNDQLDAQVLPVLAQEGVRLVAMRCAASTTWTCGRPNNSRSSSPGCQPTRPTPWPNGGHGNAI